MYPDLFSKTGLSLDRLYALLLLREKGSLIRAADGDAVKQSQLSRQIKDLSSFFETDLVIRSGKSLKLTPAGHELVDLIERQFAELSRFRDHTLGVPRTAVIAADGNLLTSRICPIVGKLSRLAPNCRFHLKDMRIGDIVDGLYENTVSLGLVPQSAKLKGLRSKSVLEVRYGIFVPDRLIRKSGALTLSRALQECAHVVDDSNEQLGRSLTAVTKSLGIQFKPAMICSSQIECIAAVRSGFYASVLPVSVSIDSCELQVVEDPAFDVASQHVAVYWSERHCLINSHLCTIRDALIELLADM